MARHAWIASFFQEPLKADCDMHNIHMHDWIFLQPALPGRYTTLEPLLFFLFHAKPLRLSDPSSDWLSILQAAMLDEMQKGMAEWRGQALAAAQAEAAARDALAAVEGQLAASHQAAAEERDRLGMEAAQCRLLCRARWPLPICTRLG